MTKFGRTAAVSAAAVAAVLATGAVPASAATSSIDFAGTVIRASGGAAVVPIVYTCTGGAQNHLYIGLKQGPNVSVEEHNSTEDPEAQINTFYSTNWKTDAAVNALNCDGREHRQTIVLKNQPGYSSSPFVSGPALLQLCMFDAGAPEGTFAYTMETVVAGGR